jgi:hypothetical protein
MYTKRLLTLSYNCYHGHAPKQLQNIFAKLITSIILEINTPLNFLLLKLII